MKSNILNNILLALFLLATAYTIWILIVPFLAMAAGNSIRSNEWHSWFGRVFSGSIVTLAVYVAWQTVGTLSRLEDQQERMARAVETLSRRVEELSDRHHSV